MKYFFDFHQYNRKLKHPLKTSHGSWSSREGIIIRLKDETGKIGYGEIAPVPFFNTEKISDALDFCASTSSTISEEIVKKVPSNHGCTRYAFETAILSIKNALPKPQNHHSITKLLPSGKDSVVRLENEKSKHKTFKWKMGILDFNEEKQIIEELLSKAKTGTKFRLDANENLSVELTKKWLEFLENKPVEFLEQPLPRGQEEAMNTLQEKFSTPLALDESALGFNEVKKISSSGWKGFIIIKPSLLTEAKSFLDWRQNCKCPLIYSTALETAVGTQIGLSIAGSDTSNRYDLGYGVEDLFEKDIYSSMDSIPSLWS